MKSNENNDVFSTVSSESESNNEDILNISYIYLNNEVAIAQSQPDHKKHIKFRINKHVLL
jgi:hypothetical protein